MGSLTSVIEPALQIGSAVNTVFQSTKPIISGRSDARVLDAQLQKTTADVALKRQQNLLDYNAQETERQRKLRAALATSRATEGAAGLGSSLSSDAVRQNMTEGSDITRQNYKNDFELGNLSLDQSLASARNLNLLQKQQLQQDTVINTMSGLF